MRWLFWLGSGWDVGINFYTKKRPYRWSTKSKTLDQADTKMQVGEIRDWLRANKTEEVKNG